jgi:hypothetical protein
MRGGYSLSARDFAAVAANPAINPASRPFANDLCVLVSFTLN